MPYSSDIQIVNDANGAAYAFLADNGRLFSCQWNAQAQRWDKGEVVPGSEGARGLQALVVDNLWPSSGSGANGAVPGNAPGIVLAYRIGEGAGSQVVASFGAWNSDGSLSWSEAQPLSSQQGSDEAFALVPAANGSLKLVLQKRETASSAQDLLAQFAAAPSQQLGQQLEALASGARKDSDLYVSDLRIIAGGQDSQGNSRYALQLSAPGDKSGASLQTTPLTPAVPTSRPATPAAAFGGNTQLSRADLLANAVSGAGSSQGLPSGARLAAAAPLQQVAAAAADWPADLTAHLTAVAPVTFAQQAAASSGGSGFSFTNYIKRPASLASLALYPVRYYLGTSLGTSLKPKPEFVLPAGFGDDSDLLSESFSDLSDTWDAAQAVLDPMGKAGGLKPAVPEVLNSDPTGYGIYETPKRKEFILSGAYGGLLVGKGGYTVVNFSTFRYGKPALDSVAAARAGLYRGKLRSLIDDEEQLSAIPGGVLGSSVSSGWKTGRGLAGSFKTLFQYSNPSSFQSATKLIGFSAQQSLGLNLLAHTARYYKTGALFSLDLSLIGGFVMEQRYASADGLARSLSGIGLGVGALGNALSFLQTSIGLGNYIKGGLTAGARVFDQGKLGFNGLYVNDTGLKAQGTGLRYATTSGGIASLGLAVGIPVGVGASQMNDQGTYRFGLGLQENLQLRLLSKYGVGLQVLAGSQQNVLWTPGQGWRNPSWQVLAYASAGVALPFGGFIPVIPNITWDFDSNPPSSSSDVLRSAAAPMGSAAADPASPAPLAAAAPGASGPTSSGTYNVAPTGSAYPMRYAPASATDALLSLPQGPIASLLEAPTTVQWHQLQSFNAAQGQALLDAGLLQWSRKPLVGLNDGTYTNVPLIGLSLPGSAPATASFTATAGVISNLEVQAGRSLNLPGWISAGVLTLQASNDPGLQQGDLLQGPAVSALGLRTPLLISGLAAAYDPGSQLVRYQLNQPVNLGGASNPQAIGIATVQGQYLALPEPDSSRYVFGLDVFQKQSGNPPPPAATTAASVLDGMPLFSLQTSLANNGSPLSTATIQRIPVQLPINALSQGAAYPKADGSIPVANDFSVYSYSNVPLELLNNDGSGTSITPLNPGVTATVKLSAGKVIAVTLDQPLYFNLASQAYAALPYTLVVDVQQALGDMGLVNPTFTVTPQQEALNNFTDQDSFSANPTINNAGVFLSSGISDQLPLLPSYGNLPVQNRVAYVNGDTVVYLNNTAGSSGSWKSLSASDLTLEAIYNNPAATKFTAASNPASITDVASNTTYVFWVEASDPVIPLTGSDGEANYQAFMNALYGHQRINYAYATTSQAGSNTVWNYVNVRDLYAPADTLITDLRSFAVELNGVQRSLLVWTEVPISALKNAGANPQELITSQLAVIKAGLINTAPGKTTGGYAWEQLFNDASGRSTIATIPWNDDRGSGLTIADLSAATLPVQVDAVARFTGRINGTTLIVDPLSAGSLAEGDLILGAGVQPGTRVTRVTKAATASSAGSYQVSTSQTVLSTNLAGVPLSGEIASTAIAFAGSFSGSGNTTLTLSSAATGLQVGDQLFGVGIDPGTFIIASHGAGRYSLNQGPARASGSASLLALPAGTPSPDTRTTFTTPVLSWSQAVRTPYSQAVLDSQPLLFVPMAGLQAGVNSLNLGSEYTNVDTFASSTGLDTSIDGALPRSSATAVQNVQGLGVLATGLGTFNSAGLDLLRNTPQAPANLASAPEAIFQGAINGTSLTVSSVRQGSLAVGELLVGEGIPAGTTIAALPASANANQTGIYTLAYAPGADSSTVLAATTLRSLPAPGTLPLVSFQGRFSGSAGANGYTTLEITGLSGALQVGDQVLGLGLPGRCTILQVTSQDLSQGTAQVLLSQEPGTAAGSYGLAAGPGAAASPYTIEFWTQLDRDSNPAGAGLVALGQPSDATLSDRPAELPTGWLLSSSFAVERLSWQEALNLSLETSLPSGITASDLYGWRWGLVADGANTRAMGGTGGSNLYRNALVLNNLRVGDKIAGVESFLDAYDLSSSDLIGLDGTPVDQIAASPTTQLQFSSALSPNPALGGASVPTTSLNGVAIDTSTALMNGGIVKAAEATANARLNTMFESLWAFEQTYGQSKVLFSLDPTAPANPSPTAPAANKIEQYGGYELQFSLQRGAAVSVNADGQIVFDVAPGVSLVSADGIDYRDNGWHYVAAAFLPEFATYSAAGSALELPRNVGTASLYIDGKAVASQANVVNAYAASNVNDAAQLLSDNDGGAIDLLALYDEALTLSALSPSTSKWPVPSSQEALELLKQSGFVVSSKTPNPGEQPGAISTHYLARTVDPNNAAKSTFTSALLPDASGALSWSQASSLNPLAATTATTASASSPSLQNALVIPISTDLWSQAGWYTSAAPTTAVAANPAGQTLKGIQVTLTSSDGRNQVIRQLSSEEVLLGSLSLAALQPKAQNDNLDYTFLSNAPALNLLISRQPSGSGDSNALDPTLTYTASVRLQFANGSSLSNTSSGQSAGSVVPLGFSTSLADTIRSQAGSRSSALATAAVLEQAPLQLKYVDSGVVLSSQASPSDPSPASSFGASQVYGSFLNSGGASTYSGWLAIAQPRSSNAVSNPAGRVWINFAGDYSLTTNKSGKPQVEAVSDVAKAPSTWLNALSSSNFTPNRPNLPLLNAAQNPSSLGGLLIKADPSAGWGQNFGSTMLVADVNNDGIQDLVIAAPQANGGGAVVIVDGSWIAKNLTSPTGQTILDLSNPSTLAAYVTVLRPGNADSRTDITTAAGFGTAIAFQKGSGDNPGTLWIGAPNYLRTLDRSQEQESTQPIGALYSYSLSTDPNSWGRGSASPTALQNPLLGSSGTVTKPEAGNGRSTRWWGAQLGTAVAVSSRGELAVSAPGIFGATVYTGTEAVTDQFANFNFNAKPELSSGLLYKLTLGSNIDGARKYDDDYYIPIAGLQDRQLSDEKTAFLEAFKGKMLAQVAGATMKNNQAVQADAVGAVMVFQSGTNPASLGGQQVSASRVSALGGRTYVGPNPFNTLGDSGFGSSLSFADLTDSNTDQLIVGATQSGGGGLVYMLDPSATTSAASLGTGQYLATLAATNIITAAEATDYLGSGLVNLGDVNGDGVDDLLIQAYNAASSAGRGYVLFSSDQLSTSAANPGLIGLDPGSLGTIQKAANGNNSGISSLAILSELGSGGGLTGQGTYGPGDYNADGHNDIALGSGPNAKGYLTWGKDYLASINDLQLSRLTSNNGFLLEGLATTKQGSLRSIGDFNGDGYGDFLSINPGRFLTNVRIELGANSQEILASAPYSYYSFTVTNGTEVLPAGDINGDGKADIALFLDRNLSSSADGNQGAGSTTGILYGRSSDDLPLGSGFGYIAPVDSNNAPKAAVPGLLIEGSNGLQGFTDATPAVIAVGTTLYAAVKGSGDNTLWFSQSRDGGNSWANWSQLSAVNSAFRTSRGPSLLLFGGRLYLSFVNSSGTLSLSSWDPANTDLSAWSAPIALSDGAGTTDFASSSAPQLVDRGTSLGVLWVQNGAVKASTNSSDPSGSSSWSSPEPLSQLVQGTGSPIAASSAPAYAWLGTSAVLAVNDGGEIKVYAALGGSSSLQQVSTFQAANGGPTIVSAPVLTSSDTGLVLTYTQSDGSIRVNRLDVLSPGGVPLPGVTINADGGVDVSETAITWQTTTLSASNSGISSALASTPVIVEGNLLLANVRNGSTPTNQIWLNAIPNASDPANTTWLNSTVQLPNAAGGWQVRQQAGVDHPVAFGVLDPAWQQPNGGLSPWAPSFAELNGVLYAAVRGWSSDGSNKQLYWNRSVDNGLTWNAWQQLPSGMTSDRPPTIAAYNGTLYLVYIGQDKSQTLNLTQLTNTDTNQWAGQIQIRAGISGASNQTAEFATLVNEGNQLALYYVGTGKNELYSTSATDLSKAGTFTSSTLIKYSNGNQTASGPLAAARVDGKTYLAYQGGTTGAKSNTIYLTSGSANDSNWSLVNGVPQPVSASHTGVGLAVNSDGLVLSYSDVVAGKNVVSLQQGRGSGSSWSFVPYTVLQSPENSAGRYDGANSLYAKAGSDRVLVSTIDSSANEAISNAWVTPRPPSLVLKPEQTGSTLTPVGDLNNDGYADLLVTANNVVWQGPGGAIPQLQTGVRLLSGAASSAALSAANDANASSQTLQLAPAFALNAGPASTAPTAAAALGGLPQLTVAASSFQQRTGFSSQPANQSLSRFTALTDTPSSLFSFFQGASEAVQSVPAPGLWGKPMLRSSCFGDLNGDGRLDVLAADGIERFQTAYGALDYTLWDIRAAGDVNGNGVDDVLLALVPQGPAYRPNADGSPSFIQPVLLDGSLFEVDVSTGTFSLDRLKAPLNPYAQAEVYDLASISSKDNLPTLQAWMVPIQRFQPGIFTGASVGDASAPADASASAPQLVVDELGHEFLVYTSGSASGSAFASQLRLGYRQPDDSWANRSINIGVNQISAVTPSAVFYRDRLYVAYADQNGKVRIAYTNAAITPGSDPALWSWQDYEVSINGSAVTTLISPTLVANHGLLTLIAPGAETPDKKLGVPTTGQKIYLASSNNPEAGAQSSWGSTFDAANNRFRGAATPLQVRGSDGSAALAYTGIPVVATVFQGQTVLAYQSMQPAAKAVVLATELPGSSPGAASPVYALKTTGLLDVNGLSLSTDQSLLYLAHADSEETVVGDSIRYFSTAYLTALVPGNNTAGNPPVWNEQTTARIGGIGTLPSYVASGAGGKDRTIRDQGYRFPTTVGVAMRQGELMGTWSAANSIQAAELSTTVSAPTQVSLAGYSVDGNIDINGDGLKDMLVSDPSNPSKSVDNQYALFGGDYLNIASKVGTDGNDVIVGSGLADVIYSLQGSDEITSNGGPDVIIAGAGDDTVNIQDNGFLRIDSGSGFDVLALQGKADQSYDFRLDVASPQYFAGTRLRDIELISSQDYGANTLRFDAAMVNAINPDRVLFLAPDQVDSIVLTSEFHRNASFDTNFGGNLWSAYAVSDGSGNPVSPGSSNPALIYVATPVGQTADWLSRHVLTIADPAAAASAPLGAPTRLASTDLPPAATGSASDPNAASPDPSPVLPLPGSSPIASSQDFGQGLRLLAYRSSPGSGLVRFRIERGDTSRTQVIAYASAATNSSALPGIHYSPVVGLIVLAAGESSQDITIPINPEAFAALRGGSLSLNVQELPSLGQKSLHLLLAPDPDRPVLFSGLELRPDAGGNGAIINFRADTNDTIGNLESLQLLLSKRDRADSLDVLDTKTVAIQDAKSFSGATLPAYDAASGVLALDNDQRNNQQVSTRLRLNFSAANGEPSISLDAPDLNWTNSLKLASANALQLVHDVPLTIYRADRGSGAVSFGLQSGTASVTLLRDAIGGDNGSISPANALSSDPLTGWLASEGKAIGSRAVLDLNSPESTEWTPTASLNGQALQLLGLSQSGNQITATFSGGVSAVYGLQATGSAPTPTPIRPQLEVQRLGRYNNALAFYAIDTLTGTVDGLNPGDEGYLQRALERSESSGLMLSADQLPVYGAKQSYTDLPLDPNRDYGMLLLVNGDRSRIYSSFSAANPSGSAQMINLGSSGSGLVLGFEDQWSQSSSSDVDYNDMIVSIRNVAVELF